MKAIQEIEKWRILMGKTQEEMAVMLGLKSQQNYNDLKTGRTKKISVEIAQKFHELSGINVLNGSGFSRENNVNDFQKDLLARKNTSGPYLVPLVPVAAQAGYAKNFYDMAYIEKLETYPIVPGIDPHGAIWRYFQVKGNSMEDTFREGQFLLTSQVLKEDWRNIENFYVYVIVTNDGVVVKRLAKVKGKDYWAAISDNESEHNQFKLPVSEVKELWKYRRHIEWDASPPKKFEIKV